MQVQEAIAQRVRELGINPREDSQQLAEVVKETFRRFALDDPIGRQMSSDELDSLRAKIVANISGFGPLQPLLDDPEIEEIWCNSPERVFVARSGQTELTPILLSSEEVRDLVERMLLASGRRIDISSPFVDAMLPGGERLHVVIPPITHKNWIFNIRKHLLNGKKLRDLVRLGSMTEGLSGFLTAAVKSGLTVLVSGATQAGKTTLLRALCAEIPAAQRIITCEEVFELVLQNHDVVAMQTRPPTLEGKGEVALRDLVKESLRMRPERLIIGEVRGAESLDLIIAMNAGVPGMCTLHANSARHALSKLSVLPLLAGENVSQSFVVSTIAATVDLAVHVSRRMDGHRYVSEVLALTGRTEGGNIEASQVYSSDGYTHVGGLAALPDSTRFIQHGYDVHSLLAEVSQ